MRTDLLSDPRIVQIASIMSIHRAHAVGLCYALWTLGDTHTADGHLTGYNHLVIDDLVGCSGFASACEEVGWLQQTNTGMLIVRFEEHNGQSAKQRAQAAARMTRARCYARSVTVCEPDKIREEIDKNNNNNNKEGGGVVESQSESNLVALAQKLARRPEWLRTDQPWIDKDTWLKLFSEAPNLPTATFNDIISHARRSNNAGAKNPAGLVIAAIRSKSKQNS
jgi:hypothetical protein